MCGIVAILAGRDPVEPPRVVRALATLAHRGPDGWRVWTAHDGRVGLGHARLAVIDLETGDQPLESEDGQIRVVVNGEFYGHRAIRAGLEARGHRFRSRSDSEILVHLWEEHGVGCLAHLRGEFAFVLWDAARGELFAARDRFGVKPLYYAEGGGALCLASEAKALFAAGVPARWDHRAYFEMCHLYYPERRSLFAGVHQVPPGHFLLAGAGGVRVERYWDLDLPRRSDPLPARSPGEQAARLRAALEEAVRLRMQADVPIGCYLSGGLDSSLVLALATRLTVEPVEAFTVSFDASHDEAGFAARTARQLGARHHVLPLAEADLAAHFADAVWHSETINPNTNGVAKYLLSRQVRDAGLRVVLTGEGADEVAAGYEFLARDMAMHGRPGGSPREREVRGLAGIGVPSGEAGVNTAAVRESLGFVPSWVTWFAEAAVHARTLWSPAFRAGMAGLDPYRGLLDALDIAGQVAGREAVHQSLYLWTKSVFANLLLNQLADRMEMAHGIEGRLPFLDGEVVEVLRDMPLSLKIRGAVGKHVLREAARDCLPEEVVRRRKQPFLAPPPSLAAGSPFQVLLQDMLRSQAMAAVPFFDHRSVVAFLDRCASGAMQDSGMADSLGKQLVCLASACVLQQRFALAAE